MIDGSNLLEALRPDDRALIAPNLTACDYKAGQVLQEPGDRVEHCFFPRHGAVGSFTVPLDCGVSVETVMIGREGALGGIVSHGDAPAYARASVMHEGTFLRISLPDLERAKEQSISIRYLFSRYADCLMAQVFQSIACNAIHTIEQRAAKWLCAAVERTGRNSITMTQEQLASMMGIGRSYASRVIQRLKRDGLLETRRGGLEVLDAERLGGRACTCNQHVRQHFQTVLAGVYPQT
ncbi:transcriptional regulator [Novosphingobium marinum]|uniref:CRP-like cAMP-binding protein n=1 Tax=Novosphingobium marinum TaxID=1514948 RepID=A0A7Z0BW06_9SPHN|nr:Crp/Fnr family transcriptional regulator [Novosphingobium marinum]NYH96828.1 CRP-like cAMP-binding protein [Novosphingobium marinum]GGC39926.1 transcriptional regulator [Novosphingobium marinum]